MWISITRKTRQSLYSPGAPSKPGNLIFPTHHDCQLLLFAKCLGGLTFILIAPWPYVESGTYNTSFFKTTIHLNQNYLICRNLDWFKFNKSTRVDVDKW